MRINKFNNFINESESRSEFNELISIVVDKLNSDIGTELAFILDEDITFFIGYSSYNKKINEVSYSFYLYPEGEVKLTADIKWDNIKDHFIPFLIRFKKRDDIENISQIFINGTEYILSFEELIRDVNIPLTIRSIKFNFYVKSS